MPARIELTGQKFGHLVVIGKGPPKPSGRRTVVCRCVCGATVTTDPRNLKNGDCTGCGCTRVANVRNSNILRSTHCMTGTPEYNSWTGLKARCSNELSRSYPYYGGRGIKVCAEWEASFDAFYADMGPKPTRRHTVDRIDVNGDYEPGNCRWATAKTQARNKRNNRRVEINGQFVALSEACEISGIRYSPALYRLNRGLPWNAPPLRPNPGYQP